LEVNVSNKVFDNLLRRHDFMSSSKQGGNEDENKRMTTILVTHSLTLAKRADMVAVVDLGKIVEIGSCEELLERNGAFRRMVDDFGAAKTVDGVAAPSTAAKSSEKTEKKEEKAHGGGPIDEERFRGGVSWLSKLF
jgi:ABC-type multidrug transport system ATPase subunit